MNEKTKAIVGAVLFLVFTAMFIIGCMTPEVGIVFKKAANICLECIGIGG